MGARTEVDKVKSSGWVSTTDLSVELRRTQAWIGVGPRWVGMGMSILVDGIPEAPPAARFVLVVLVEHAVYVTEHRAIQSFLADSCQ